MMFLLVGLIILCFLLQMMVPGFTRMFCLDPSKPLQIWRLVTNMFLHAGASHIFFNLFALLMFGPLLYRRVGRMEFYKIFLLGGLSSSLFYFAFVFLHIIPPAPALGASGAIYAILGALAIFMPNLVVFIGFFPMRMREAVFFWMASEFLFSFASVDGIAHAAHLGGLLFGIWYGKRLKEKIWYEMFFPPPIY
jgi:membrane associated rhomboid family serine protease